MDNDINKMISKYIKATNIVIKCKTIKQKNPILEYTTGGIRIILTKKNGKIFNQRPVDYGAKIVQMKRAFIGVKIKKIGNNYN
tara:strand:+ start:240 stop:488 length:249 start_codon:yes stop_codon:yes gene_type:complete